FGRTRSLAHQHEARYRHSLPVRDLQIEPVAKLPEMMPGEQVIEDYRYLSLSLKAHPVSFMREELRKAGVTRNVDLLKVA
ncbi:hypothetical protein ACC772_39710, partial [Rhizobium ruizarguesonis]